jgi:large subunit ribosomal protein L24
MDMPTNNPGKQRLDVYTADILARHARMGGHLSKELRQKYGQRHIPLRLGDSVKVMRGDYKGKTGTINQVDHARNKVFIQGLMRKKTDGKEAFLAFRPSNLLITSLDVKDKKRFKRKAKKGETKNVNAPKTRTIETGKKE